MHNSTPKITIVSTSQHRKTSIYWVVGVGAIGVGAIAILLIGIGIGSGIISINPKSEDVGEQNDKKIAEIYQQFLIPDRSACLNGVESSCQSYQSYVQKINQRWLDYRNWCNAGDRSSCTVLENSKKRWNKFFEKYPPPR